MPALTRFGFRLVLAILLFIPLAGLISIEAWFAPRAEPWPRWQANDPTSTLTVDHGPWSRFLEAYLSAGADGVNRVAYAAVTSENRSRLEDYLAALSRVPVSALARAEQRAYWINLYNALTIRVVLEHYPVASIRDIAISPGLFTIGPWDKPLIEVEGQPLTLNDIEHRILRPIWRDPRLHYAVNCASIGCPNLQPVAFTAANTEALLEAAARAYVNHPRGARFEDGRLVVSSIYVWFQEDFGASESGVIEHLRRYADPPLAAALDGATGLADHAYDWRLNAPERPPQG